MKKLLLLAKKKFTHLTGGKWITVTNPSSPLHGHHIYINEAGKILAGAVPAEMHGKTLAEVHEMHGHMEHSHADAAGKSKEQLHEDVKTAEAHIKAHEQSGAQAHQTYWEHKKEIAEHHIQVKDPNHVIKRPIPDEAPHVSKKPIHNTYSKKSPAELKAIIAQAKANIAAGKGNGYDKKVINIASYYLNGGQMPPDEAFGPKNKKLKVADAPEKKEEAAPEAPKEEEKAPEPEAPKYSGPHQDKAGFHQSYHNMSKEDLEDAQEKALKDVAKPTGVAPVDEASKKKLDIINHYLKEKGGEPKEFDVHEHAPHKDKYPGTHNAVKSGDPEAIKAKQEDLVNQMNKYIADQNKNYYDVAKEKLDIANYYGSQHGVDKAEAPEYKEKKAPPHYLEMKSQHKFLSGKSAQDLKNFQDNLHLSYLKGHSTPAHAQKVNDVVNHYLSEKGEETKDLPKKAPHMDKKPLHDMFSGISGKENIQMAIDALKAKKAQQKEGSVAADLTQKKIDIGEYYLNGGQKPSDEIFEANKAQIEHDKTLDGFNNPANQVQTGEYKYTGQNVKDLGVNLADSNQVHSWNKPIIHDSQGQSFHEIKDTAGKLMNMLENGDSHTGLTSGSNAAKRKLEHNLANTLMHNDDFLALSQVIRKTEGYDNYGHDPLTGKEDAVKSELDLNSAESRAEHARAAARTIIAKWAGTSADHDSMAIAMQLAAKQEFGLNNSWADYDPSTVNKANERYLNDPKVNAGVRSFLREQYNQTQDYFKKNGITHVPIVRGMGFDSAESVGHIPKNTAVRAKMSLQPLSSFSASHTKAHQFTGSMGTGGGGPHKLMIAAMIPVERILGNVQTGYGCMGEHEYVVMGQSNEHDDFVAYRWHGSGNEGSSFSKYDGMFKFLADLGNKPKEVTPENGGVAGEATISGKIRGGHAKDNGNGTHDFTFNGTHNGEKGTHTITIPSHHFKAHTGDEPFVAKEKKAPPKTKKPDADKVYHFKSYLHGGYAPAQNAKHVPNEHGIDAFVHKIQGKYQVNDGDTGVPITSKHDTQKKALEAFHWVASNKLSELKEKLSKHPHMAESMVKHLSKSADGDPVINIDADLHNADWTKQSWDEASLPKPGTPEFKKMVQSYGGMKHFMTLPVYQHYAAKHGKNRIKKSAPNGSFVQDGKLLFKKAAQRVNKLLLKKDKSDKE